jgi:hypothetical protein
VGHKEEREPLRIKPSSGGISTKDRGGKPNKILGLDKPSLVVTTCLHIEVANALCNATYTFSLWKEHNNDKGGSQVAFVAHAMLAHWWKKLLALYWRHPKPSMARGRNTSIG